MVSLLDFLNGGGDRNHNVGGHFNNFGEFFAFNSFDEIIYLAV
jgi:hypothetical protein